MSEGGARYIGDVVFDALMANPEFMETARELVTADWRTGADSFREYAKPLLGEVFTSGDFGGYGDFSFSYLERRVMDGVLDVHRDPWVWAYAHLIGAYVDPETARNALNHIQGR